MLTEIRLFPMMFLEHGFVIPKIKMTGRSPHEQLNHPLCFGRVMQHIDGPLGVSFLLKHHRKCQGTKPTGGPSQKFSSLKCSIHESVLAIANGQTTHLHGDLDRHLIDVNKLTEVKKEPAEILHAVIPRIQS